MDTVEMQISKQANFDEMVKGAAKMDTAELERYHHQIGHILATRKAKILPKRETELLLKINQGVPDIIKKRFDALSLKMKKQQISIEEQDELRELVDQIELLDAQRLECLIELALLRNMTLEALLSQMGLKKADYA